MTANIMNNKTGTWIFWPPDGSTEHTSCDFFLPKQQTLTLVKPPDITTSVRNHRGQRNTSSDSVGFKEQNLTWGKLQDTWGTSFKQTKNPERQEQKMEGGLRVGRLRNIRTNALYGLHVSLNSNKLKKLLGNLGNMNSNWIINDIKKWLDFLFQGYKAV